MLADPEKFWNMLCGRLSHKGVKWDEEDVAEYKSHYFTPEGVHGVSGITPRPGHLLLLLAVWTYVPKSRMFDCPI
jgi:hypothetical protein